jgi:hypothetical protein
VLLTADSTFAGLTGTVYENHWHQLSTLESIYRTNTLADMLRLVESWKVRYLIAHIPRPGDYASPETLRALLAQCTVPEYEYGGFYLARIELPCRPPGAPAPTHPTLTVSTGTYDDFNPAIAFSGEWEHNDNFSDPEGHTISFSAAPGAEASIEFQGRSLTWDYTKAPNRGLAEVTVDGTSQGTFDLYAPEVEWQTQQEICCFPAGRHLATIKVLGRSNPASKGWFVDVDSLTVR